MKAIAGCVLLWNRVTTIATIVSNPKIPTIVLLIKSISFQLFRRHAGIPDPRADSFPLSKSAKSNLESFGRFDLANNVHDGAVARFDDTYYPVFELHLVRFADYRVSDVAELLDGLERHAVSFL